MTFLVYLEGAPAPAPALDKSSRTMSGATREWVEEDFRDPDPVLCFGLLLVVLEEDFVGLTGLLLGEAESRVEVHVDDSLGSGCCCLLKGERD